MGWRWKRGDGGWKGSGWRWVGGGRGEIWGMERIRVEMGWRWKRGDMGDGKDQGGDGLEVEEGRYGGWKGSGWRWVGGGRGEIWGMERIRVEMGWRWKRGDMGDGKDQGGDGCSGRGVEKEEGGLKKRGKGDGEMGGKGRKEDRKGGERGDIICWRCSYKVLDSLFY